MKRIALMSAALWLGWITPAGAMDREGPSVSEQRSVQANSADAPHLSISNVPSAVRNLSLDTGLKNKAAPLRRLDTYTNPAKNAGNDPKTYNPIRIPLW
jgi:hypothetical protein